MSSPSLKPNTFPIEATCLKCNLVSVISEQEQLCLVIVIKIPESINNLSHVSYEWKCRACKTPNSITRGLIPLGYHTNKLDALSLETLAKCYPRYVIYTETVGRLGQILTEIETSKTKKKTDTTGLSGVAPTSDSMELYSIDECKRVAKERVEKDYALRPDGPFTQDVKNMAFNKYTDQEVRKKSQSSKCRIDWVHKKERLGIYSKEKARVKVEKINGEVLRIKEQVEKLETSVGSFTTTQVGMNTTIETHKGLFGATTTTVSNTPIEKRPFGTTCTFNMDEVNENAARLRQLKSEFYDESMTPIDRFDQTTPLKRLDEH